MDHRHTEDFARQMEAAALRAHALRREAITVFWAGIADALRATARRFRNGGDTQATRKATTPAS